MRLCRLLKRKVIISLVIFIAVLILLRQILLEQRRVAITKEILSALGSRNTKEQVKPYVNTTIINTGRCKPDGDQNEILALVVVICRPEEFEERKLFRSHWNRWKGDFSNTRLLFFLGLPKDNNLSNVQEESLQYDDIVIESMQESYYSLTLKTLLMLKWHLSTCSKVKYLVKSDLDTFIHLPNLVMYLNSVENQGEKISKNFIGGDIAVSPPPIFDPYNKWYMPPELLETVQLQPESRYPDYVLGGFYVLSSALIPALFSKSLTVPLIQFEDVYLTGFVAKAGLGIELTNIPEVYSTEKPALVFLLPMYYKDTIISCHVQGNFKVLADYERYHQANYEKSLDIKSKGDSRII